MSALRSSQAATARRQTPATPLLRATPQQAPRWPRVAPARQLTTRPSAAAPACMFGRLLCAVLGRVAPAGLPFASEALALVLVVLAAALQGFGEQLRPCWWLLLVRGVVANFIRGRAGCGGGVPGARVGGGGGRFESRRRDGRRLARAGCFARTLRGFFAGQTRRAAGAHAGVVQVVVGVVVGGDQRLGGQEERFSARFRWRRGTPIPGLPCPRRSATRIPPGGRSCRRRPARTRTRPPCRWWPAARAGRGC